MNNKQDEANNHVSVNILPSAENSPDIGPSAGISPTIEQSISPLPFTHSMKYIPPSKTSVLDNKNIDEYEQKSDKTNLFKKEIGIDLRKNIKSIIEPNIIHTLRSNLKSQRMWRLSGKILDVISKIIVSLSAVPAFLASVFDASFSIPLSTISGVMTVVGAMFFLLASKSQKESREAGLIASRILNEGAGIKYEVVNIAEPINVNNEPER